MILLTALLTAVLCLFINNPFGQGLITGGAVVWTGSALYFLVAQMTGTVPRSMGATAEQWTAAELRPLRNSGWRIANHVALRPWDIDHVGIGPMGIFAVETKWSAQPWVLDPPEARVLSAIDRAADSARDLRRWAPIQSQGVGSVGAVVFLWGGRAETQATDPSVTRIRDVTIVRGARGAKEWRTKVMALGGPEKLSKDQTEAIWTNLEEHVRRREKRESLAPTPPSLMRLWLNGLGMLFAAALGFLAVAEALTHLQDSWMWALLASGIGVPSYLAVRLPALRPIAAGWLAGSCAALALLVALVAIPSG